MRRNHPKEIEKELAGRKENDNKTQQLIIGFGHVKVIDIIDNGIFEVVRNEDLIGLGSRGDEGKVAQFLEDKLDKPVYSSIPVFQYSIPVYSRFKIHIYQ